MYLLHRNLTKEKITLKYYWDNAWSNTSKVWNKSDFAQWSEFIEQVYPDANLVYHINDVQETGTCNGKIMLYDKVRKGSIMVENYPQNIVGNILNNRRVNHDHGHNTDYWVNYFTKLFNTKLPIPHRINFALSSISEGDFYCSRPRSSFDLDSILDALDMIKRVKGYEIVDDNIMVAVYNAEKYDYDIWYINRSYIQQDNNLFIYDLNSGWLKLNKSRDSYIMSSSMDLHKRHMSFINNNKHYVLL